MAENRGTMNQTELLTAVASSLTMRQYADIGAETAVYPSKDTASLDAISYCALGLAGEAGEIALKVDHLVYRDTHVERLHIVAEVGDVLWYIPRLLEELKVGTAFIDTTFSEYQESACSADLYRQAAFGSREAVTHYALLLAGKAGNAANKVKKLIRDSDTRERRLAISTEAYECLWASALLLRNLAEAPLGEVALANIIKLADRQKRGTVHGDGDNR